MLHILLLILKIIGIILGVLLGIILLGIVLALFVPVRYRVEALRTEGEENPPVEVKAKAGWLLHFVNIRIRYPSEVWLRVRILFITVFKLPKQKKVQKNIRSAKKKKAATAEKNGKASQEDKKKTTEVETAADKMDTTEAEAAADKVDTTEAEAAADKVDAAETGSTVEIAEKEAPKAKVETVEKAGTKQIKGKVPHKPEPEKKESSEKKSRRAKFSIKKLWIKICKFFQNIWYTITGICDRIKTIWENIEYYLDILRSDTFKDSYTLCKDELHTVFSYIKPRKFQADLTIGLGDPAATAKILSYYGILYPLVGNHVNIVPDFDEKRIEGTVLIKGKIRLFTFIKAAVRIYFNKDIRRLIKLFMKEDV